MDDYMQLDPRTLNTALKAARLLVQAKADAELASAVRVTPTMLFWVLQDLTQEQWNTLADRAGEDHHPSATCVATAILMQSHIMKTAEHMASAGHKIS